MPAIIQYFLKLSVSAAVIYAFYYLVLRRLTFYSLNRWYLTGYTLLCLVIPFINIDPIADKADAKMPALNYIPIVQNIKNYMPPALNHEAPYSYSIWDAVIILVVVGSVGLLGKLAVQMVSFVRLKRKAKLISDKDSAIYHVDEDIMPFSFGKSIYLNKNMHNDRELGEIIMHEYVHVKQMHSADILIAELFCVLNWYNPFAWFIRHSIRQNLEFIADDNVVRSGIDKKAYQYHLLKVVGIPQYRLANQFNFSSLKKRIIMMNRAKSAKINLLKFMFILPLLAVTLMAFRSEIIKTVNKITVIPAMTADKMLPVIPKTLKPLNAPVPAKSRKAAENKNGFTTGIIRPDSAIKKSMNVTAYFAGDVLKTIEINNSYLVILRMGDKFNSYGNLTSITVKKGDQVKKGQVIGTVDVDTVTGIPKLKFSVYNGTAMVYDNDGSDTSNRSYAIASGYGKSDNRAYKVTTDDFNSFSIASSGRGDVYMATPGKAYTITSDDSSATIAPHTQVYLKNYSSNRVAPKVYVTARGRNGVDSAIRISGKRAFVIHTDYAYRYNADDLAYTIDPRHIDESDFAKMEKEFADNGFKLKIKSSPKSNDNRLRIEISASRDNSSSSASANFSSDDLNKSNTMIRVLGNKKTGLVSIVTYPSGR